MENLFLLLAAAFMLPKEDKRPKKYVVSSCGCTAVLPTNPYTKKTVDEEGNPVYIGQSKMRNVSFGFATVELQQTIYNKAIAEQELFLLMERMHDSFSIVHTTGLEYGFTHPQSSDVQGMTEFWQDTSGTDWKVQGWTDGKIMTVLYVKNINAISSQQQDAFLNSFRLNLAQKLVQ